MKEAEGTLNLKNVRVLLGIDRLSCPHYFSAEGGGSDALKKSHRSAAGTNDRERGTVLFRFMQHV